MTPRIEKLATELRTKWRDINRNIDTYNNAVGKYPNGAFSEKEVADATSAVLLDLRRFAQLLTLGQETTLEKLDVQRILIRVDKQKSTYAEVTEKV